MIVNDDNKKSDVTLQGILAVHMTIEYTEILTSLGEKQRFLEMIFFLFADSAISNSGSVVASFKCP